MSNTAYNHEPFLSYSKITDNIYLGASMCCGEHESDYLQKLLDLDIFCEMDLRLDRDIVSNKIPSHVHLPMMDTYPPTNDQMQLGVDIIESVVTMGKNIYIHCNVAHGRSPTMVIAYYIVKKGMSYNEAYNFVKGKRPEVHPTDRQVEFLISLEK